MESPQHIANDNEKVRHGRVARLKARRAGNSRQSNIRVLSFDDTTLDPLRSNQRQIKTLHANATQTEDTLIRKTSTNLIALIVWISTMALLFYASELFENPVSKVGAGILAIWSSLFLIFTSRQSGRNNYRLLGIGGLFASITATGFYLYTGFNIGGSFSTLLCLGAFVGAFIGMLIRESFLLFVSLALSAIWIGSALNNQMLTQLFWMFPALISLQMYGSTLMRSKTALIGTASCFYAWFIASLYFLALTGAITVSMSIGIFVIVSGLHAQIGYTLQDNNSFGGLTHSNIGWSAVIFGLLLYQDNSLGAQSILATGIPIELAQVTTSWLVWCATVIAALIALGFVLNRRRKTQKRHGCEVLTILGCATILAFVSLAPDKAYGAIVNISSNPALTIFLVIGGLIASLSLAKAFNGARRSISTMILLGIIALSAEAILVADQIYNNSENLMVFGYSVLLISLGFAGLAYHNGVNNDRSFRSIEYV